MMSKELKDAIEVVLLNYGKKVKEWADAHRRPYRDNGLTRAAVCLVDSIERLRVAFLSSSSHSSLFWAGIDRAKAVLSQRGPDGNWNAREEDLREALHGLLIALPLGIRTEPTQARSPYHCDATCPNYGPDWRERAENAEAECAERSTTIAKLCEKLERARAVAIESDKLDGYSATTGVPDLARWIKTRSESARRKANRNALLADLKERDATVAELEKERDGLRERLAEAERQVREQEYRGNSVEHWHIKATAYGDMVAGCAPALEEAGYPVETCATKGGGVAGVARSVKALAAERDDLREKLARVGDVPIVVERELVDTARREGAREAHVRAFDAENAVEELRGYFEECTAKAARDMREAEGEFFKRCTIRRDCYKHVGEMIETYFPSDVPDPRAKEREGDDVLRELIDDYEGGSPLPGIQRDAAVLTQTLAMGALVELARSELCRRALGEGGAS